MVIGAVWGLGVEGIDGREMGRTGVVSSSILYIMWMALADCRVIVACCYSYIWMTGLMSGIYICIYICIYIYMFDPK